MLCATMFMLSTASANAARTSQCGSGKTAFVQFTDITATGMSCKIARQYILQYINNPAGFTCTLVKRGPHGSLRHTTCRDGSKVYRFIAKTVR
jgi:hypothetical protein